MGIAASGRWVESGTERELKGKGRGGGGGRDREVRGVRTGEEVGGRERKREKGRKDGLS